jgi:hypothetical protein
VFDNVRLIDVSPLYRFAVDLKVEKPAPPWLADVASAVSTSIQSRWVFDDTGRCAEEVSQKQLVIPIS